MRKVSKPLLETAIQYNGTNLEEITKDLNDQAGQIQPFMDGMLKIDTQHGRLAVRVGEWIIKNGVDCYQVYSNDEYKMFFEEIL